MHAPELPPVLIIDDDPLFRSLTSLLLESRGATVSTAEGCREALSMLPTIRPGVALVDMVMPEFDGVATIRRLRAAAPDMVFVACSGHDASEFRVALAQMQVTEFIAKPFTIDDLLAAIDRARGIK
jgi:DNA-binding NtrC family response regulator